MYSTGPDLAAPLIALFGLAVGLFVSYFIIKAAVREGMKEHTRWQVANRAEIESTYAKKPQHPATPRPPQPPQPPAS